MAVGLTIRLWPVESPAALPVPALQNTVKDWLSTDRHTTCDSLA
jgi:hypothetical protein